MKLIDILLECTNKEDLMKVLERIENFVSENNKTDSNNKTQHSSESNETKEQEKEQLKLCLTTIMMNQSLIMKVLGNMTENESEKNLLAVSSFTTQVQVNEIVEFMEVGE